MGKNPFLEVEAANNARFAEWMKTRAKPIAAADYRGEGWVSLGFDGMITPIDRDAVQNMRECVRHAADYYAKETGFAADRFIALIDVNELLAAESPMAALEAALTAGEAKIRSEAQ